MAASLIQAQSQIASTSSHKAVMSTGKDVKSAKDRVEIAAEALENFDILVEPMDDETGVKTAEEDPIPPESIGKHIGFYFVLLQQHRSRVASISWHTMYNSHDIHKLHMY